MYPRIFLFAGKGLPKDEVWGVEKVWELFVVSEKQDEIQVSVGEKGVSLKAKGTFVSRWGHSLADLFKPFTAYVGSLGDGIEHHRRVQNLIRVYNENVLKKTLTITLQKCESLGITPKPVKVKFLTQWSEAASLEDIQSDENIAKVYANILVSEIEADEQNSLIFLDILKKMTNKHVQLLEYIARGFKDHDMSSVPFEFAQRHLTESLSDSIGRVISKGNQGDEVHVLADQHLFDSLPESINYLFQMAGVTLFDAHIRFNSTFSSASMVYHHETDNPLIHFPEDIFDALESLNLINHVYVEEEIFGSRLHASLDYVHLTRLGYSFFKATHPDYYLKRNN